MSWPLASVVALLLVNEKGQLTPPWPTRPVALQLSVEAESVPVPVPLTVMLPAQVPLNCTFALVAVSGVTVYFTLPQPVAGFTGVTDDQLPANAFIVTDGLEGDVGVVDSPSSFFLLNRSQP